MIDQGIMSRIFQQHFEITTTMRGTTDITASVSSIVSESGIMTGVCHVFLHHTSASLMLCENSDPEVHHDLERFFSRLVPDGDEIYRHVEEGPDDMSSHVRSVLTTNSLTVPVTQGVLALGRWQGIYLWEHRTRPHLRKVTVTLQGVG